MMNDNFMKLEKRNSDSSDHTHKNSAFDFGDDFLVKSKKKCNTNNLLALMSNDDFTNIQENIMKGLKKGENAHEESKHNDNREEEKLQDEPLNDSEEETVNMEDDTLPQNLFYQYRDKEKSHMRYDEDSDDGLNF